jgi:hypothetical protein
LNSFEQINLFQNEGEERLSFSFQFHLLSKMQLASLAYLNTLLKQWDAMLASWL